MLIDWFTVGAQMINFLILVWLLKRFLYKPILLAIDAREKGIAVQITQAASKEAEAQKQRDDFQHKSTEFDQQRGALLTKAMDEAKDEAKVERQGLLDQARKEFDALRAQQKETLSRERASVSERIAKRTSHEVFAIARKTLSDLASTSLEQCMVEVFTKRLLALNPEEKAHLTDALKASPRTAHVRSAFDLPPAQRAEIESAVKASLTAKDAPAKDAPADAEIEVRFETAPDLVSGIELTGQGYKVCWSIADYLASIETSVTKTPVAETAVAGAVVAGMAGVAGMAAVDGIVKDDHAV